MFSASTFLALYVQGFLDKSLIEKTEFIDVVNVLQLFILTVFQECTQPSDAWNFSIFNYFEKPMTFSSKIVPLIGMFSDLCISNHF